MTAPSALRAFMADPIRRLARKYEVSVFCNFSADACENLFDATVTRVHIPFERKIRPWADLRCLFQLSSALRRGRFDSVHSIMPKTGLLAMAAGWLAGVPVRVHMFTGQVWVTRAGFWRMLLKSMDRLIAWFATDIYADSPSQRDFLVAEKVIRSGKVLGDGSVNGVDCDRFKPDPAARAAVRAQLGIPQDAVVFGFLGRLNTDKGIGDLVEAFASSSVAQSAHLLLVGPDEEGVEAMIRKKFPSMREKIYFAGSTDHPERYYPAFDVFCIPSYREGFGSSVIEAAACGVPALASRIYGLTDAVAEGVTGLMHAPHDVSEIRAGLETYAADSGMRQKISRAARQRVLDKFQTERLVEAMAHEYERLLAHG